MCQKMSKCHTIMFEVLKIMARDNQHHSQTGYGPLLPDQNVFRDAHVYRSAVIRALGLEAQ